MTIKCLKMPLSLLCCVRQRVEDVQELDYSHCSLTDVPSEVFVFERTLERLHCQCNRISELPRQLFMCHGLKLLDVSDNELQAMPVAISALVNLQSFNVSKNAISTLPDTIKNLKHLTALDLSVNPLEKLPEAITNLLALQELYLNDSYLEYLPGNFGRLVNLRILELRDNYLMILPKSLARSTDLERLDIGQNEFQQFPEVIGKFTKLVELWLDSNSLTVIPSIVKSLTHLVHLEASSNLIEEIPDEIANCTELVELSLSSNNLTQLPDSIGYLNNLVTLKLDCNKLYSLPESFGQLSNLEDLTLLSNYLAELPRSVGLLRKLQSLNADENMLRSIPPEIGSCSALTILSLRSNKLTFIPSEIGHLSSLRVLNLVRNSLHCLPQTLLNCGNLVALWLSENQSKPLVPMQSEIDPVTYQQVLTCFLFPQVPLSPIRFESEADKSNPSESQPTNRHISFVDMKAAAKAGEKPGQLRRAPTPYPKELRALAKHAKSFQKDVTQDTSSVQNAVHIKAAKITPTLQQRFASNHSGLSVSQDVSPTSMAESRNGTLLHNDNVSSYENSKSENPYDKPLEINYEQEKSYQNMDHTLYSGSNDSAYGGLSESSPLNVALPDVQLRDTKIQQTMNDRVDGVICHSSHAMLYMPPENAKHESFVGYGESRPLNPNHFNVPSERYENESFSPTHIHFDNLSPILSDSPYGDVSSPKENVYGETPETNYHGSVYGESYAQAKEKIYGRRRDIYRPHPHRPSQVLPRDVHSAYSVANLYAGTSNSETGYFSSHDLQQAIPNNSVYNVSSSPSFATNRNSGYAKPCGYGHENAYAVQKPIDQNTYGNPHSSNVYNYKTASVGRHSSSSPSFNPSQDERSAPYNRGQPPPYHIAAAYSKQAQFFNGAG